MLKYQIFTKHTLDQITINKREKYCFKNIFSAISTIIHYSLNSRQHRIKYSSILYKIHGKNIGENSNKSDRISQYFHPK